MSDDKSYIIDTNVFRFYANHQRRIVQPFWEKVQSSPEYNLYLCDEIDRELTVQATNGFLAPDVRRIRNELYPLMGGTLKYTGNIEQEHILRLTAAHIKYKYGLQVPSGLGAIEPTRSMEYPAVSDARIILTAIANACGIVTNNLKDFAVLAVFGYEVLDPMTDRKVEIEPEVMLEIAEDSFVLTRIDQLEI